MRTITIRVYKDEVLNEVAKCADYTGAKMLTAEDSNARERIMATDADLEDMERYWEECVSQANEGLKEMLLNGTSGELPVFDSAETEEKIKPSEEFIYAEVTKRYSPGYECKLVVANNYNDALTESVATSLKSFFVNSMVGSWFKYSNKAESPDYFTQAATQLDGAVRMLMNRKRPRRPK